MSSSASKQRGIDCDNALLCKVSWFHSVQWMPLALVSVGLEIDMLSLWCSLGELGFETVDFTADRGSDLAPKLDQ